MAYHIMEPPQLWSPPMGRVKRFCNGRDRQPSDERPRPTDTHPEVERVQIALIRQASVARRLHCMASLSENVIRLSRRAIARAHPEWNQQEVDIAFVALHYGEKLADALRNYLEQGRHGALRHLQSTSTRDPHA